MALLIYSMYPQQKSDFSDIKNRLLQIQIAIAQSIHKKGFISQ